MTVVGALRKTFDLSFYFVVDPSCCGGRDIVEVVLAAVRGGATMVQLRNKHDPKPLIVAQAALLAELLKGEDIPFLVNDYPEIARDVEADGVHIGQDDMSAAQARAILGEDKIIGLTAFTDAQISAVDPHIVDYIGTGPFFPTQTDKGKPVLGAARFSELAALSPVPVVGIGGITAENAAEVLKAGADGVAVMRAISESADPMAATQRLRDAVQHYRLAK